MEITADAVLFPPDHQGDFGMRLQPDYAVNNVTARFFQTAGHINVVFFVKTGLDFHKDRHLLTVSRGIGEGGDNSRFGADPVKSLLDGQDLRIFCGHTNKRVNGRKSFIRVMHHYILRTNTVPYTLPAKEQQVFNRLRYGGRIVQLLETGKSRKREKSF